MAAPASSRRQSTRQVRTSSIRPTNYYARAFRPPDDTTPPNDAGPGFFPAITHFTDSVAAIPKEMIQHFSMLKEVEAKLYDPERLLEQLLGDVSSLRHPTIAERQTLEDSNNNSMLYNGALLQNQIAQELSSAQPQTVDEKMTLQRRQLFFHLRNAIATILPTLDEKIVVLNNANNTLRKGLARMDSSFAHIDDEISEEARYGSAKHWAYTDLEDKRKTTASERNRRDVASTNNLAAAAAAVHDLDIAASRSEARREAMMAKRRDRNQHLDSDFDDGRHSKKPTGSRARKTVEPVHEPKTFGLGISGTIQTTKKRKPEKTVIAPAMERTVSENNTKSSGKNAGASPRETPVAESAKRKAPRAAPGPAPVGKKRQVAGAQSPHPASSPVIPAFAPAKEIVAAQRPPTSRGRQNSISNTLNASVQEPTRYRPSSSSSNLPPIANNIITDLEQGPNITRVPPPAVDKSYPLSATGESGEFPLPTAADTSLKREETEMNSPVVQDVDPVPAPVTTRAGRTSKPATPMLPQFPDSLPMVRSRSTRNNNGGSHTSSESNLAIPGSMIQGKRSHKKSASVSMAHAPLMNTSVNVMERDEDNSSAAGEISEDGGEDGDEPRYCYCNGVSYGQMIACDNKNCPREWFHLDCVGLTTPPNSKTKWYCDDCKENVKKTRPGSRQ